MNVSSNPQALVLAEASLPARTKAHSEPNAALGVVNDNELRKRVTVLAAPSDSTLVWVRTDYFSRTDARDRAFVAEATYSDSRTPNRDEQSASSSAARQFTARDTVTSSRLNPAAQYARIQEADTQVFKGAYIDVFA